MARMQVKCPSCKESVEWEESPFRPFCSEQCKNRDLGDWASERYRIAEEEESPGKAAPKPGEDETD